MPTVPIRGLAAKGILRDPADYELDLDAWSNGANMRFHANKAERAPIWRIVQDALPEAASFCVGLEPTGEGYDSIMVHGADGRIWQYGAGTFSEVTEDGHTPTSDPRAVTGTYLAGVLYINRPDAAPRYFGPTSTKFAPLPNMETTWTCRSLRAFGDFLIAMNVTKPLSFTDPYTGTLQVGGAFPTMFKASDLAFAGQVPGSWDPDDPSKNTVENILEELTTGIVDGLPMRNIFVIYSEDQIWAAEQTGDQSVFAFQKLFAEGGLIAPNCVVEVDGIHYVFGPKDIYRHDGVKKESIIDKRNKSTVYRWLNKKLSEVCFVSYMPEFDSIVFGFNSGDPNARFTSAQCDRCNVGAVYDITADTWSFIDLPNVASMTSANVDTIFTYASLGDEVTYENVGGSYYNQDDTFVKHPVAVSGAVSGLFTESRVLAYDFADKGSLTLPAAPECIARPFVERTGMALDQLGSDLTTYKKVRRLFPLVGTFSNSKIKIEVGGSDTPSGPVTWAPAVMFDPSTSYKVDVMKGGRYLAIRFSIDTLNDFEIAGYDLDVSNSGRR